MKLIEPCPFCGSISSLMHSFTNVRNLRLAENISYSDQYWVKCDNCQVSSWSFDDADQAIKHWNKRVEDNE